jgi:hypothetical protein
MPQAPITASAAGNTTIIPGSAGFRWRVASLALVAKNSVDVQLLSASAPLTGVLGLAANQHLYWSRRFKEDDYIFYAAQQGDPLVINLSASVVVGGWVVYDLAQI